MVTPAPRRTVRRVMVSGDFFVSIGMLIQPFWTRVCRGSSIQELLAGHNAFHHRAKAVVVGRQPGSHLLNSRFIGKHDRPAQRIGEQFPAKIIDKIVLPVPANEIFDGFEAGAWLAGGEFHRVSTGRPARSFDRFSPMGP